MRWENLYVAGVGAYLPEAVQTADEAVLEGRYDPSEQAANGGCGHDEEAVDRSHGDQEAGCQCSEGTLLHFCSNPVQSMDQSKLIDQ